MSGAKILPLALVVRAAILMALFKTNGNRADAARALGVSVRTIRNKLKLYRKQGVEGIPEVSRKRKYPPKNPFIRSE